MYFLWLIVIVLSSCSSVKVKLIGKVSMIATRNVESKVEYGVISSYAGSGKKELKRNKGETIEQAIDNLVRTVPGGEFLKNVKIYKVGEIYYAVEGDVCGSLKDISFHGWHKGDTVQWKANFKNKKGRIINLKDDKTCTVKEIESEKNYDILYEDLTKIE